jgi:transposase-like protein
MWVGPPGGEGAKFWMNVLTELRNRGIHDVFMVCCDCDDDGVLLRTAA